MKSRATAEREEDKKTGSCQWLMAPDTAGFTVAMKRKIIVGHNRRAKQNIQALATEKKETKGF